MALKSWLNRICSGGAFVLIAALGCGDSSEEAGDFFAYSTRVPDDVPRLDVCTAGGEHASVALVRLVEESNWECRSLQTRKTYRVEQPVHLNGEAFDFPFVGLDFHSPPRDVKPGQRILVSYRPYKEENLIVRWAAITEKRTRLLAEETTGFPVDLPPTLHELQSAFDAQDFSECETFTPAFLWSEIEWDISIRTHRSLCTED